MNWQKLDLKNPPKGKIVVGVMIPGVQGHGYLAAGFIRGGVFHKEEGGLLDDDRILSYIEPEGNPPDLRHTFSEAEKLEIYKDQLECEKNFLNATIRSIDTRAEVGHVIFTMNNFKRKAYTQERIAQIDKTLESLGVL